MTEDVKHKEDEEDIKARDKDIEEAVTDNEEEEEEEPTFVEELLSWVWTIGSAVVLAFLITTFLIVNAKVPTGSMENTVMTGDRLIANRLSYLFSDPERYDIVVFKYPDDESVLYIKRIIGMPGDTVEVRDGHVYVNGDPEPLREDFLKEPMEYSHDGYIIPGEGVYEVPEGCYFMMGDNRNHSSDSRFWNQHFVKREKILGKAVFRYFPRFKIFKDVD